MRRLPVWAVILWVTGFVPGHSSTTLHDCLDSADRDQRDLRACVGTSAEASPLDPRQLRSLETNIADQPDRVLALLLAVRTARAQELEADPQLDAAVSDLIAEAQRATGDSDSAANTALAALAADPGLLSVRWRSSSGAPVWSADLDAGGGRHFRAARALVEADRDEEAVTLLRESIALGADEAKLDLWRESGGGELPGIQVPAAELAAPPWLPPLPDVEVVFRDGETRRLRESRGNVLILDFWASWCEPCLKELPALGRLYEAEKERGLDVILINLGEPPDVAERFLAELGLRMPTGRFDASISATFQARVLPTVIVADRQGRVRGRWDGYVDGLEERIAKLTRDLLGEVPGSRSEPVGRVFRGSGLLEVSWMRLEPGIVEGLGIVTDSGVPSIVTLTGRFVLRHDGFGAVIAEARRPPGTGELRSGDLDGDGIQELFSFRVGGRGVAPLTFGEIDAEAFQAPAPLLDLAVMPGIEGEPAGLLLASLDGLYLRNAAGTVRPIPGVGETRGLIASAPGGVAVALSAERGVCSIDPTSLEVADCHAADGFRVVRDADTGGWTTLPWAVSATVGAFLPTSGRQIALVTPNEQLVLLDAASGEEIYRAAIPRIHALVAGDLDGDGLEEMIVAAGNRLMLLQAPTGSGEEPSALENSQVGQFEVDDPAPNPGEPSQLTF